jgi:CDP-diacylglycerol--glycerol-3-phosphate 3-phosphatidyltransferase
MFDGKFRKGLDATTAPVGRVLVRCGVSADVLTGSGLLFALITTWAISRGWHWTAIILLTLTGAHDMFDGAVAKASGRASQRGSFFDSVIDRVSDSVLLFGCAWFLVNHHEGKLILLPFAIMTSTFMISYTRAKAESLGLYAKGGLMERAERMILLGVALLSRVLFVPVLWVMLVLTTMTALGRFLRVWRQAQTVERTKSARGVAREQRRLSQSNDD